MTPVAKISKLPVDVDKLMDAAKAAWKQFSRGAKSFKIEVPRAGKIPFFVEIELEEINLNGAFDITAREIFINPKRATKGQFIRTAIHEMRHAQQFSTLGHKYFKELNRANEDPKKYATCPMEADAKLAVRTCLALFKSAV